MAIGVQDFLAFGQREIGTLGDCMLRGSCYDRCCLHGPTYEYVSGGRLIVNLSGATASSGYAESDFTIRAFCVPSYTLMATVQSKTRIESPRTTLRMAE